MLTLLLAEAAIELIPKKIWRHPSVLKHAKRRGKKAGAILLDRSYHHSAMKDLKNAYKRGRPDITHLSLLIALGTPLNKNGLLKTYIQTRDEYIIHVNHKIRLPKNYIQFTGLIEQLYELGRVPKQGTPLLELKKHSLQDLFRIKDESYVVTLMKDGEPKTLDTLINTLIKKKNPVVVIGAFPHGRFSKDIIDISDESVSIYSETLEAWTVTSRVIYEYEKALFNL
jgi:rRNA small subunit pseudouridine methyltransferase Nep1